MAAMRTGCMMVPFWSLSTVFLTRAKTTALCLNRAVDVDHFTLRRASETCSSKLTESSGVIVLKASLALFMMMTHEEMKAIPLAMRTTFLMLLSMMVPFNRLWSLTTVFLARAKKRKTCVCYVFSRNMSLTQTTS